MWQTAAAAAACVSLRHFLTCAMRVLSLKKKKKLHEEYIETRVFLYRHKTLTKHTLYIYIYSGAGSERRGANKSRYIATSCAHEDRNFRCCCWRSFLSGTLEILSWVLPLSGQTHRPFAVSLSLSDGIFSVMWRRHHHLHPLLAHLSLARYHLVLFVMS